MRLNEIQNREAPVRVLVSLLQPDLGGIARDVAMLVLQMDRKRFVPHVLHYINEGMWLEDLVAADVPVLHLPIRSIRSRAALSAAHDLYRFIRRNRIQVVHAWDSTAALTVPVARLTGVPVVLSSVVAYRTLLDPKTHQLFRFTDNLVHGIVVNCEAMRQHLIVDEKVPSGKIELCYSGVETDRFYPNHTELPGWTTSLLIGAICVLRPEKALQLLEEAFARVRHLKSGMKLLVVGSGEELPALQANARRLGIEQDCVFEAATRQVPRFLRAIDIFVVSSRSEAFPNALLEAMACGCACVGPRIGGIPELLGDNGERGLLFTAGDAGDLAQTLERLILDSALRQKLGVKASQCARSEWTIEKSVETMCAIYSKYLEMAAGK